MRGWLAAVVLFSSGACEKLPPTNDDKKATTTSTRAVEEAPTPQLEPISASAVPLPNETQRRRAVGDTAKLSPLERAAYEASAQFSAMPVPGPSDWLSIHPEPGQTFDDFRMTSAGNRVTRNRKTIYLQPIDQLASGPGPTLKDMREFTHAFFGLEVALLPPLASAEMRRGSRTVATGRQLLTQTVLASLRARVPKNAYAVLGLTREDLYPGEGWNFVFGQATYRERIGIHSLARYAPSFYGGSMRGAGRLMRKRAYTVLAHEIGHMFGMHHCPYYHCVMNGSNGLSETDRTPLHLCPVCLRKLQFATGVDLTARHQGLARHLRRVGLASSADWHSGRAQYLKKASREDPAENATARR